MAYSFQTFAVLEVLTSTKMNQVEVNIRDHVHGSAGVALPAAGSILQAVTVTLLTAVAVTSDALAEVSVSARLAITPKAAASTLRLRMSFTVNLSSTNIWAFAFYDVTNAAYVGVGETNASRRRLTTAQRGGAVDTNDSVSIVMEALVPATNTTARTYTLYCSRETTSGSGTATFNASAADSAVYGFSTPMTFTIDEIAG